LTRSLHNGYNPGSGAAAGGHAIKTNSLNSMVTLGHSPASFNRGYAAACVLVVTGFVLAAPHESLIDYAQKVFKQAKMAPSS
jgi:hypothetical protein